MRTSALKFKIQHLCDFRPAGARIFGGGDVNGGPRDGGRWDGACFEPTRLCNISSGTASSGTGLASFVFGGDVGPEPLDGSLGGVERSRVEDPGVAEPK